jgi:hypothetical protein
VKTCQVHGFRPWLALWLLAFAFDRKHCASNLGIDQVRKSCEGRIRVIHAIIEKRVESAEGAGIFQVLVGECDELPNQFRVAMDGAELVGNNRRDRAEEGSGEAHEDGTMIRGIDFMVMEEADLREIG